MLLQLTMNLTENQNFSLLISFTATSPSQMQQTLQEWYDSEDDQQVLSNPPKFAIDSIPSMHLKW